MTNSLNHNWGQFVLVCSIIIWIVQHRLFIILRHILTKVLFLFPMHVNIVGVFASFGLSGIIPAIHYGIMEGWFNKISQASLGWLILMGKSIENKISYVKKMSFGSIFVLCHRTPLHPWCNFLCSTCSRTMVSRQIWFMGKTIEINCFSNIFFLFQSNLVSFCLLFAVSIPPNFPCPSDRSCICSLSWN